MADDFKYHIDHHSALIAPAALVRARGAAAEGRIGAEELRAVEDRSIEDALHAQRRLGLAAVGDGQFRRRNALSPYYDRVIGFGPQDSDATRTAAAELVGPHLAPECRPLTAKPEAGGRLVQDEASFLAGALDRPKLISLPSPGYVAELGGDASEADAAELAKIVHDEIEALAREEIAYVQLHNPLAGVLLTKAGRERAGVLGLDADAALARMRAADEAAIADLKVPEEFRVGLDLVTAAAPALERGYDRDAVQAFLNGLTFTRLCVEYPEDAAARFPLDLLAPGTVVSLGVVDVADPELEDVDTLVARIDEAATVIDIDDIAISTNGPFTTASATLDEARQRAKLQLVEMTARYFWGNEL